MPTLRSKSATLLCCFFVLAFTAVGCAGGDTPAADTVSGGAPEYVVERSDADGVETVRTVSGSRWGSTPRLIDELSIGEELGDDAYLFGAVTAAWATSDRIYVVDSQVPAVRAFDHQGNHLFDIGGPGQGPGEYTTPMAIAVRESGEVLISDVQGARITEYDVDGNRLGDWTLNSPMEAMGMQLTYDGEIYTRMVEMPDNIGTGPVSIRQGMQPLGPDGTPGEPIFPAEIPYDPPTTQISMGGRTMSMAILPFTPSLVWDFSPGGDMVAGVGAEYSFRVDTPDGRTMWIEKAWQPVSVDPGEKEFRAEAAASQMRQMDPEFVIPEDDVPGTKPAFTRLVPDRAGRVWVTRQGPSVPDPACREAAGAAGGVRMTMMLGTGGQTSVSVGGGDDEIDEDQDCWANTHSFDIFDLATGDFLGNVEAPEAGFLRPLYADEETVVAAVTDELGTVRVKKYRLAMD